MGQLFINKPDTIDDVYLITFIGKILGYFISISIFVVWVIEPSRDFTSMIGLVGIIEGIAHTGRIAKSFAERVDKKEPEKTPEKAKDTELMIQ